MTTFRTGNHHGVTIVAEPHDPNMFCCNREDHDHARGQLVAVVTNGDTALAERICALLNAAARQAVGSPRALADALDGAARDLRKGYPGNGHPVEYVLGFEEAAEFADGWATADQGTADRSYLRGASEALAEVRRQLERDDFNLLYTKSAVWQRLHAAARELGVDEATPARSCTCPAICPDCDSAIGTNYRAGCEGCATHIVECVGVDETTQVSASPLPLAAQQSPPGGDGGQGSLLRHLLIENGPYAPGHTEPFGGRVLTVEELNEFRNELLGLLILRSKVEAGQSFRVDLDFWNDSAELECLACGGRISFGHDPDGTLAELSQRAEKHAEECTP